MHSHLFKKITSSAKQINNQTLLILGCGHKNNACRYTHPNKVAWTIDINASMQPNSLCDVRKGIPKEIKHHQFDAIILEFLNVKIHNTAINIFQSLLRGNGCVIIAGAAVCDVNLLHHYDGFYYESKNILILCSKNETQKNSPWWQHAELNIYLKSLGITEAEIPYHLHINDDQKNNCYLPDTFYQPITIPDDKTWEHLITLYADLDSHITENNSFSCIVNAVIALNKRLGEEKKTVPLTYNMLYELLDSARENHLPGLFRSKWAFAPIQLYNTIANTTADIDHDENTTINDQDRDVIWDLVSEWGNGLSTLPYGLDNQGQINEINAVKKIIMHLLISDQELIDHMKNDNTEKPVLKKGSIY